MSKVYFNSSEDFFRFFKKTERDVEFKTRLINFTLEGFINEGKIQDAIDLASYQFNFSGNKLIKIFAKIIKSNAELEEDDFLIKNNFINDFSFC